LTISENIEVCVFAEGREGGTEDSSRLIQICLVGDLECCRRIYQQKANRRKVN
jgi:hypothetical protein